MNKARALIIDLHQQDALGYVRSWIIQGETNMSQNYEGNGRRSAPDTPRWVKVFVLVATALVLLLVILMLISPGNHGPRRHIPTGDVGVYTLPLVI